MSAVFDLQRFVDAQDPVYRTVCEELRAGRKQSHWMWFVFPQLAGIIPNPSTTSRRYGIASLAEAWAYLEHPILGRRLRECSKLLLELEGQSIEDIMGYPDDLKLRSCMTLFSRATDQKGEFAAVLDKYFEGEADPLTLKALKAAK